MNTGPPLASRFAEKMTKLMFCFVAILIHDFLWFLWKWPFQNRITQHFPWLLHGSWCHPRLGFWPCWSVSCCCCFQTMLCGSTFTGWKDKAGQTVVLALRTAFIYAPTDAENPSEKSEKSQLCLLCLIPFSATRHAADIYGLVGVSAWGIHQNIPLVSKKLS